MGVERQSARRRGGGRVVVVGAGVGGLACAIDLAAAGREVVVVERAERVGGKLREVDVGGRWLDAGPTVFTLRAVFDELFAAAGADFARAVSLEPCAVLARHAWADGARLDLHASPERSAEAIEAFVGGGAAGRAEAAGFRAFCARAADIHATLDATFMRASRPTPASLVARAGWRGLPGLLRISPFATLWGELGRHFRDPRLRQLFGRYATYLGSSPFAAPATLMLVAHVEQSGVWRIGGGMHRLAEAMRALAERHGAVFRCGAGVRRIVVENGRVAGVGVGPGDDVAESRRGRADGDGSGDGSGDERIDADAVVFAGDVAALGAGLLGGPAASAVPASDRRTRSLSAITWNAVATTRGFPLLRHNVFFGADYEAEFGALFGARRLPDDPTVYVCAQDRGDDAGIAAASPAGERLLLLVNAPARGDDAPLEPSEVSRCLDRTMRALTRAGLSIEIDPTRLATTTPTDFARLFPGSGGALYGRATHGWAASFARPGARAAIPGLYLAGGTVHPGPGLPMATLSGRQAAASVMEDMATPDRASTPNSLRAATPGGTSMP